MAKLRIGTSGWHYDHWLGPFYPPQTLATEFLAYYATWFRSVEINASFYRLPTADTIAGWHDTVPDDFVFACKASRYITHMKKLKDPAVSTERFFAAVTGLGRKLGPILFQLPPRWRCNAPRLAAFLERIPRTHRYAFEFRDQSWFDETVYEVLREYDAALCCSEFAGTVAPLIDSAPFAYVRLHGPAGAYQGQYSDDMLDRWATRIAACLRQGRDVYCYFDNDEAGYAALDAARLQDRFG